jgi:hypothetical protein
MKILATAEEAIRKLTTSRNPRADEFKDGLIDDRAAVVEHRGRILGKFAVDSPLEGNGFELPVREPRSI